MHLQNYYFCFPRALPVEFCDEIINRGKEKIIKKASVEDKSFEKTRNSLIAWMNDGWIYEKIQPYIQEANVRANWNFDLSLFEKSQFTIYKENHFYDWHQDSHHGPYDNVGSQEHGMIRKLSVTISLEEGNNYEGGNLEFDLRNHVDNSQSEILSAEGARAKGSIIVFPSFVWHRVTPVTKGTRYSLVIWSIGKPFR